MSILGTLAKSVVHVATLPVAAAADVVTLGGQLTDRDRSFTEDVVDDLEQDVDDILDDI